MSLKKIGICGHFGKNKELLNGQTIKTKIVTNELEKIYGTEEIQVLDTHKFVKKVGSKVVELIQLMKTSKNIMMFPAHKGLRVMGPLIVSFNKIYHRKLHYVVIGGWLPEFLEDKKYLTKCLKKFDCIYVETTIMKEKLMNQGFNNVIVVPNCKELTILKEDDLVYTENKPYKLCTFSRVMKEKGIEDAINAVKAINEQADEVVYTLDIYGQVDKNYIDCFKELTKTFPEYINYTGMVPFDKSVDTLKNYYALLFPTYYEGEGFAGTLLDAFASGVPVITSDWRYNTEIVKDKITGVVYKTHDNNELINQLKYAFKYNNVWKDMKKSCLIEAKNYEPKNVIKIICKQLS